MNKNIYAISIIVFAFLFFITACRGYENWESIQIEGYGNFKVPEGWLLSMSDDFMYLSSEESGKKTHILVQYYFENQTNEHFAEIEDLIWLQDEYFSNSSGITKYKVCYQDGSSKDLFMLHFTDRNTLQSTDFLCLDDSISEDTLKRIAKSYIMGE